MRCPRSTATISARILQEREINTYYLESVLLVSVAYQHTHALTCGGSYFSCHLPSAPAVSRPWRVPGPLRQLDWHQMLEGPIRCCRSNSHRGRSNQSLLPPKLTRGFFSVTYKAFWVTAPTTGTISCLLRMVSYVTIPG